MDDPARDPLVVAFLVTRVTPTLSADELAPLLRSCIARGRGGREFKLKNEAFAGHLGRHCPPGDERRALDALPLAELYLACALAGKDEAAMREFTVRYEAPLRRSIARVWSDGSFIDDVYQGFLAYLLSSKEEKAVPHGGGSGPEAEPSPPGSKKEEGPPHIAQYAGRGPLLVWLRIGIKRAAFAERARLRRVCFLSASGVERLADEPAGEMMICPAGAQLPAAGRALRELLAVLPSRFRRFLPQMVMRGLKPAQIARDQHVHRANVGRWLRSFQDWARMTLRSKLALSEKSTYDVMQSAAAQLDLSLQRTLGASSKGPGEVGSKETADTRE